MTIAAGFHCSDGIVLCADTEHEDYVGKYQREKIFNFQNRVIVTGAGDSDYIKMAFNKLCECEQAPTPTDARQLIEAVSLEIYDKHVLNYYEVSDRSKPRLDLIVAMRCSNGEPVMVKTAGTVTMFGGFFESVGAGKPLFEYWAQLLYHPELPMNLISYLCLLIVQEVKQNVAGCGGHTFVAGLPNDASRRASQLLYPEGSLFAGFPRSVVPLLVQCRDLRVSDAEWQARIDEFVSGLRMCRQQERIQTNAMVAMKHGVLPDAPLGSESGTKALAEAIEKKKREESGEETS